MVEVVFGTTNPAKVEQVKGALAPTGIIVKGIESTAALPDIAETGETPLENARIKALAYAKLLGKTVFAMDNGLYFNDLESNDQPGVHVRRLPGYSSRPTDAEMIEHYLKLIGKIGEEISGYWEYGICIANKDGDYRETTIKAPRIFVNHASSVIQSGYPLESLQIDPDSGKYMSELTKEEQEAFWQKTIGQELRKFIQSVDL